MGGTLLYIPEASAYEDEAAFPDLICTHCTSRRGLGQKQGFSHLPNTMTTMHINAVMETTCDLGFPQPRLLRTVLQDRDSSTHIRLQMISTPGKVGLCALQSLYILPVVLCDLALLCPFPLWQEFLDFLA